MTTAAASAEASASAGSTAALRDELQEVAVAAGATRELPGTLIFDYPTIRQIRGHLYDHFVGVPPKTQHTQRAHG